MTTVVINERGPALGPYHSTARPRSSRLRPFRVPPRQVHLRSGAHHFLLRAVLLRADGGQGLPMPSLPARFFESATILRRGVGESVWLWVAAGSRLWTFIQAVAFG